MAPVPLWRNRNFCLLWSGSASAFLGLFSAEVAFSLLLLARTGSPGLTSLFTALQMGVAVLAGMPAGRLLDRHDRRLLLVAAETARMVVFGTVVASLWLGRPAVPHLLAAAAVLGAVQPFGTARMLLLRSAVAPEQLTTAVTAEEVRTNAAELSGPPLGGFLYGVAQVLPFVVSLVLFAVAAAMTFFVRVPAIPAGAATEDGDGNGGNGLFGGLAAVMRDTTMRSAVLMIMLVNGVGWPVQLIVVVSLREQGAPSWQIGLALSGLAVGGLAGTTLVGRLHRLLPPGKLLVGLVSVVVPVLAGLALPLGAWWVGLMCVCFGLAIPALRVLVDVLVVRQIPDEQRGRALNGVMTLFALSVPVAMLFNGLLLEHFSTDVAPLVLAGILFVGVAYAASRRTLRQSQWPADDLDG